MNEKLTREQRDEILGLICQAPKDNRPCDECETQYFCNILTANTAEDDCQHKNMSNTNTHNKSGILQSAKICNDCNVVIPDPTEDEGNYIVWSDGRKTQIEDEELLQYIAENIQQEASDAPKV